MAFAFFRRHQKWVLALMVLLMISFLVSGTVLRRLTERDTSEIVVGEFRHGEITQGDLMQAQVDLERLADQLRAAGSEEFVYLMRNRETARLAYALLLKEADQAGVTVTDADISQYFAMIGYPIGKREYDELRGVLRADGITEQQMRAMVGRWLKIFKHTRNSTTLLPPGDIQLKQLYRDLRERMSLRMVTFEADDYVEKVPAPTTEEENQQFSKYKDKLAGTYPTPSSFGFGYKWPDRVNIAWMFVNSEPIERIAEPTEAEMRSYYRSNREKYVTSEDEPGSGRELTYAEAREQIARDLSGSVAQQKLEDLAALAERAYSAIPAVKTVEGKEVPVPALERFEQARKQLISKELADRMLDQRTVKVRINGMRLDEAVATLAEAARLDAICYPWGEHGNKSLDPSIRVSIPGDEMSLRQALIELSESAGWQKSEWVVCTGIDSVLFPVGPVDMFPLQVGQTGLSSQADLLSEPIVGSAAMTPRPRSRADNLVSIAFQVKELLPKDRNASVTVGNLAPRGFVRGMEKGMVLWVVQEAEKSRAPELKELTQNRKLRSRVIEDVKIRKGFQLAVKDSKELLSAARKDGASLESAAKAKDLEPVVTRMFGRLQINPYDQANPIMTGVVYEFRLPTRRQRKAFIDRAFAELSPEDVEPPYDEPSPVVRGNYQPVRTAVVMERADFEPAVQSEFDDAAPALRNMLAGRQMDTAMRSWFHIDSISKRMDFERSTDE